MAKKFLSLTVAIMLFSVTALTAVQAASAGETKTYTIYNTVDGTTSTGVPAPGAANASLTERIALHKLSNGAKSFGNNNEKTSAGLQIGRDSDSSYFRSALLRFPLSIPHNEVVTSANLVLTPLETRAGDLTLKVYSSNFTNSEFGNAMVIGDVPAYSVLTAADSLIGTADTISGTTQYIPIEIDITPYIKSIEREGHADLAVADPNATDRYLFFSVLRAGVTTQTYKPHLVITTEPAPFSDSVITWDNEYGTYTVTTTATSGTAMLIAASFNGNILVDAKVITIDAEDAEGGVISDTVGAIEEGTSMEVYLWNPTTLVSIINVTPIP